MTLVLDSSAVATALTEAGSRGRWAAALLRRDELVAPHLMPVEVANMLRRLVLNGLVPARAAALAHDELTELPIALFPYRPFAWRVWELRGTVTPYDAWYVALAESLGAPLATDDVRLTRAPGPRCAFEVFDPAT